VGVGIVVGLGVGVGVGVGVGLGVGVAVGSGVMEIFTSVLSAKTRGVSVLFNCLNKTNVNPVITNINGVL